MTNKPILSEPVALADDICLTAAGVEVAKEIASDLGDCANVARLIAHQIPGGYVDLQSALFLLERDLERQAAALDELVQPS